MIYSNVPHLQTFFRKWLCFQVAQQSADAARRKAEEVRKEINPLQHPIVQRYLQQK
jgi:hypothetical protein